MPRAHACAEVWAHSVLTRALLWPITRLYGHTKKIKAHSAYAYWTHTQSGNTHISDIVNHCECVAIIWKFPLMFAKNSPLTWCLCMFVSYWRAGQYFFPQVSIHGAHPAPVHLVCGRPPAGVTPGQTTAKHPLDGLSPTASSINRLWLFMFTL